MKTPSLWEASRQTLPEALEETADLLREYGPRYERWAVAYSGGKDSTAALVALLYLIATRAVERPRSLVVLYADTRMELPPLHANALALLSLLRSQGIDARVVLPAMDDRLFVYMFGRGVPPPSNTFRWCTDQLKIEPMAEVVRSLGTAGGPKTLMLTGVRIGESARRDETIAAACSRDGAECGQGRMALAMAGSRDGDINRFFIPGTDGYPCDTLAPVLHWRTCHVWDFLNLDGEAPDHAFGAYTERVADAYGFRGEKRYEEAARTGCVGCNLASRDLALDRLVARPRWAHLAPLKRLRPLYAELKRPRNRLRKPGGGSRKDGALCKNQNRMGPLTFDARRAGLAEVKAIQAEVCAGAARAGEQPYSLIDADEEARILELIAAETWPHGWAGTEPRADEAFEEWHQNGTRQLSLFGEVE